MGEQRSPKPQGGGSSPSTPARLRKQVVVKTGRIRNGTGETKDSIYLLGTWC